jgi:hypothetical protein
MKSFCRRAVEMFFLSQFMLFTILFRFGAYLILCLHFNMFWQAPVLVVFLTSLGTHLFLREHTSTDTCCS